MARKIVPAISLGIITVLAIIFLAGAGTDDKDILRQTFQIDAVYYDSGYVEISYFDKSDKTNSVVMEILGMEETFQKTFSDSEFIVGLEYLIEQDLIVIPTESGTINEQKIPIWIKNNAKWWAEDLISDEDFINSIQYLVNKGIIRI